MFKKVSLMGLLVTAFVGTTAYGMDEKDERRGIAHAQPAEWAQREPTVEELVAHIAQYEKKEAEAAAAAKAKQEEEDEWAVAMRAAKEADEQEAAEAAAAKAKQEEAERIRAQQVERDYRVSGTNLGKDLLADANVQSTLNTPEARNLLAFFGTSP